MNKHETHAAIHRFASGIPLSKGDKALIVAAALAGLKEPSGTRKDTLKKRKPVWDGNGNPESSKR